MGAAIAPPSFTVATLRDDVLDLEEVADLEMRHRERRLSGDRLGLEGSPVGLDHADPQRETFGWALLRFLSDGFLRLQLLNFVLEHLARAVGVHPHGGVVEDARREYCYACYTGDYPTELIQIEDLMAAKPVR